MTTLTLPLNVVRPIPKKLGPPERRPRSARDDYFRQLSWAIREKKLDSRVQGFLHVVTFEYSDAAAKDFYPSQTTMAGLLKRSRRTVQRYVAAAKASGLLDVAQVKGFDGTTWYCSSNTHRPKFLPEWMELRKAERAEKLAEKRRAKIEGRAQRPGSKVQGSRISEDTTYAGQEHVYVAPEPPSPPTAAELEENRKRHAAARAILEGRKPPP